jgi:hypothetical protein
MATFDFTEIPEAHLEQLLTKIENGAELAG